MSSSITGLPSSLTGSGIDADADLLPVYDQSAGTTKKITVTEVSKALTFLPSGTGAISRTAQAKLREQVSVDDFSGSDRIQKAIDAMSDVGGEVLFLRDGYDNATPIVWKPNVRLLGKGAVRRWRSTLAPVKINCTGAGGISIAPAAGIVGEAYEMSGLHWDGTNATAGSDGLYLNATAAGSAIEGVLIDRSAFTNFPRYQALHDSIVFDVTYHRVTLHNSGRAADDCVHIQNNTPSQITFDDCFILPYTAGKWGVKVTSACDIRFIAGTVSPQATGAGANGIDAIGGLFIFGTHIEGQTGQTGTIGIRYVGSTGAFIAPSTCTFFGSNIQIGDGTASQARGWTISGSASSFNAGGKGDVYITNGGSRIGQLLSVGFANGNPTIINERLSMDGVSDVMRLENNAILTGGSVTAGTGFGCNTKAAQTAYASGGALNAYGAGANGLDSGANMSALHAMVVSIRAALIANGIMS